MRWLSFTGLLVCVVFTRADQKDPNVWGDRSAIVHLFEWKFSDVAAECERFLAPNGYAGVQVSPVHENLIVESPYRTWWESYQLVSYKIFSRFGDENAFRDMVRRCNNVGVRIYVDVVFNHMTQDMPDAHGQDGDTADPPNRLYPAVPYGPNDFHAQCVMNNMNDPAIVRNCELGVLHDLDQSSDYVRGKMIEFLNHLVDCGVAGFRVDAAKHMWPADLEYIYGQTNNLNTDHGFASGTRPFFYQEVVDFDADVVKASEYTGFGRVTEFKYGAELSNAFRGNNPIRWLSNFGPGWGFMPDGDALVFVDNHDLQRTSDSILSYKTSRLYKMAVAFMLAFPYGYPRVMSSYYFDNPDQSPPQDSNGNIISPSINSDGTCGNGWVCEHRWREIYNMVGFRNAVAGTGVTNWWDNADYQIAFCRGDKGFIAFNDQANVDLKETLQTCLPAGTYCDVVSGDKENGSCSGKSVVVGSDGTGYIQILSTDFDGVLAIHAGSKL